MNGKLKATIEVALAVALLSCTNPSRDNILDPANAPVIEMEELVVADGAIQIRWRYQSLREVSFRITRTSGDLSTEIARLDGVADGEWQTASVLGYGSCRRGRNGLSDHKLPWICPVNQCQPHDSDTRG